MRTSGRRAAVVLSVLRLAAPASVSGDLRWYPKTHLRGPGRCRQRGSHRRPEDSGAAARPLGRALHGRRKILGGRSDGVGLSGHARGVACSIWGVTAAVVAMHAARNVRCGSGGYREWSAPGAASQRFPAAPYAMRARRCDRPAPKSRHNRLYRRTPARDGERRCSEGSRESAQVAIASGYKGRMWRIQMLQVAVAEDWRLATRVGRTESGTGDPPWGGRSPRSTRRVTSRSSSRFLWLLRMSH